MLRHVTLHRVISRTILLTGLLSWGKPRLDAQSSAPSRDLVLFNNATIDLVRVYLVDRGSHQGGCCRHWGHASGIGRRPW